MVSQGHNDCVQDEKIRSLILPLSSCIGSAAGASKVSGNAKIHRALSADCSATFETLRQAQRFVVSTFCNVTGLL